MSSTLILGDIGAGKTSLMACFVKSIYKAKGRRQLSNCNAAILKFNKENRGIEPFELLEQPPIYTDLKFDVKFKVGYNEWYTPYMLNPYYMGTVNNKLDTQYLPPYSQIFISEMQTYVDSRKSITLPPQISALFAKRRHFHFDIYMDGQRGIFIDKKVREMCDRIIEIQSQEHERDGFGRIIKTIWYVREFEGYGAYEDYLERKGLNYIEKTYEYEGNVFKIYNSYSCASEFVPPMGKGAQFSILRPLSIEKIDKLPKEMAKFYNPTEPKGFRTAA